MPSLFCRLSLIVVFAICAGLVASATSVAETNPDGRLYQPSDDVLADIQQAISRADDGDRLALVVLGANWCHDSRALASRLHQSPLAELIQQQYELVFVDVEYYELDRKVLQQFGVAHYYATPTVLIVDPSSGQVVNNEDRHLWGNAYSIDMASSVQYFQKWAANEIAKEPAKDSSQLLQLYAQIDRFEQQLAKRLVGGYAAVGPMLQASVEGNEPEDFDASWDELRDFRAAIPNATRDLRDEAQRRVSDGEQDIILLFSEFPLLSWEKE
ncbi:MAG: thioredoxin family protein [Gammaproteobacteria bacterium]|nr:thioredoxin family protein [Gammaproteobacteria bacterium]